MHRTAKDAGGVLVELEKRVGKLERSGRGFSIPSAGSSGGTIASDSPPPAPSDPNILWIDTDDGNKIYRWDGSKWVPAMDPRVDVDRNRASTALASWQDTAASGDGLVTLHRQSAAPGATGLSEGDLWVDTDTGGLWRWSGTAWGELGDTTLGALLALPALSSTVADGRVRTWWQFNPPTAEGFGDLWVKTSDSPPTLWRWNNFDWIQVLDWSLLLQQEKLATKVSTWQEPSPPTSTAVGDLWYDTSDQLRPYRAEAVGATTIAAGQWVPVRDEAIAVAQETADQAVYSYVVEYSVSASETVAPTTGWSTATPVRTPGTFIWTRTTVTRNDGTESTTSPALLTGNTGAEGDTGPQGVPGPPGEDGQQLYTWIKYADTPTTGMSDDPTGKAYLGLAYNKTTAVESATYSDYQWSLVQGQDGVAGPAGADGQTTYTWVKYGTSDTGAGLADDPTGKTYIGLAYNKPTATESTDPAQYQWALIQGPAGANAKTINLTATAQVLTAPAGGGATTPTTATVTGVGTNTTIDVWDYSMNGGAWTTALPAGVSRSGNIVTVTGGTMTARTIAVRMGDGAGASDTLTVAKVLDGATGTDGSDGAAGPAGADAYTVVLTNEAHAFPGSTTAALAGSTTSQVLAFEGATQLGATIGTITGQVAGLTTAITNNGTTTAGFTVTVTTSLVATSGVLTVPVTVDGVAFSKRFSWTVSRAGATGSTGSTGAAGVSVTAITPYYAAVADGAAAPAKPTAATPPAPWSASEPGYAAGTVLYRTEKVSFSDGTFAYTNVTLSSSYIAAAEAMSVATTKNSVYRQPTRPWEDGATGHSGDVGDLWFDTSPGPGTPWDVTNRALTSNVATLTTSEVHNIQAGWTVLVSGVDETFDGSHVVSSVGASTVSYALTAANVVSAPVGSTATVQGQGVGAPINHAYIWDGSVWNDAQDAQVTEVTSTLGNQAAAIVETQSTVTALQTAVADATLTAYAADGRISISDYEPLPEDVEGKNEGSLWITRTRDRLNFITNPSFEASVTSGWALSRATRTQVSGGGVAPDGGYVARITNDGTTLGIHNLYTNPRLNVIPGQTIVFSGYVRLVSGVGTGYDILAVFHRVDGTQIAGGAAGGVVYGPKYDLPADGSWIRPYVEVTVPDEAATASFRFYSPAVHANDVWEVDAVLGEVSGKLGRYFDGDSPGGSWTGDSELSESELDGGAIIRLFELADAAWVEKFWTADTISSVYAGSVIGPIGYTRPAELEADTFDGALVGDNTLAVDKQYAAFVTASEPLMAGDLVNVWNNEGLFMARKATAGTINMAPNPSFEVDTSDYSVNQALASGRSSAWAADGTWSMYHQANGTSLDGFIQGGLAGGAQKFGMVPGRTYTVSATIRLTAAQTGTLDFRARRIAVYVFSSNPNLLFTSDAAPNAAGETRLSVTFTIPDDPYPTSTQVRFYNGSGTSGQNAWWDAIQVTESPSDLAYFGSRLEAREAHGFVLESAGVGDPIRVYHQGYDELLAGLAPGQQFLSTTAGRPASAPPSEVGNIVQRVGFAPNPGVLNFAPAAPVAVV